MKLEDFKSIIDEYFENTSPKKIIKRFEALGYEFEPTDLGDTQPNFQDMSNINELSFFGDEFIYNEDHDSKSLGKIKSADSKNLNFNPFLENLANAVIDYKELKESIPNSGNRQFAMAA